MRFSPLRLLVLAVAAATALGAGGVAWELVRFGPDTSSASERLEAEVRTRLRHSEALLRQAAADAAGQAALIDAASFDRDRVLDLFAALPSAPDVSVAVYVPSGAGEFRVLAWSEGPGEDLEVPASAFDGPVLFVAPGTLGLRLVAWHPVRLESRTIAVAAAEQVLSMGQLRPSLQQYYLPTSFGPVPVVRSANQLPASADTRRVAVLHDSETALLDIAIVGEALDAARGGFRRRVLLVAALPLVGALLALAVGVLLGRGSGAQLRASVLIVTAGALLAWLANTAGATVAAVTTIGALTAAGLAVSWPVVAWWRSAGRRGPRPRTGPRMAAELLSGGVLTAALLWTTYWVLDRQLTLVGYDRLASPLLPPDAAIFAAHAGRHLLAFASLWAVTAMLARLAERWRISWRRPLAAALTGAAWVAPTAVALLPNPWSPLPTTALVGVAAAAAGFALSAVGLRRLFRHASQSSRLLSLCAATVIPAVIWYPVVEFSADRTTEHLIESSYAPATLGHPQYTRTELAKATDEIDNLPDLAALLSSSPAGAAATTDAAFRVWSQTGLSESRLPSAVELYGPDGRLTSRFALNVPEYGLDQSSADARCQWNIYGEVSRFGAQERPMLHAELSLCEASGASLGSVVVHVLFDYRALPFVSDLNPYDGLLRLAGQPQQARPHGIQTVVYGWGRVPTFTSGQTAWPLEQSLLSEIERSREPFWTTRRTDTETFRVYFANDRAGIYAFGYPVSSAFDHLTRLAESTALAVFLFLLLVGLATIAAPLTGRPGAPLRAFATEVRTSFYRKLFLFFVFTAVLPVLVLAFTFSAYMGDKLRGDVETEALHAATVARRVLEDTIALQQVPPTDDVLVWIGQVINQDVNLYDGPTLRATSKRELFDSGLLPERTPAPVFRAIALERLPSFVAEDRAEAFSYLVAAAPVPALGRGVVLSVPLALRQQEIEREITDLNRGVLLGAVFVILLSAFFGASVARRVSDPVERLTRATQQIAAGHLDVRIVADTVDELQRLVKDFNSMAATLRAQRAELGRTHELKAWADMSRQVAHDIKNPLTPIQLAAEHLQRVHEDQQRPLGDVFDRCISTVLMQVKLLRQIAGEFSTFAAVPVPRLSRVALASLLDDVVKPYRAGLAAHTRIVISVAPDAPDVMADRTLLSRAVTNLIENALQALPSGGLVELTAVEEGADTMLVSCTDDGIGMSTEAVEHAFEPHFSTKTGGSGLGLANARRNIESCGGTIAIESAPGQGTSVRVRIPVAKGLDEIESE